MAHDIIAKFMPFLDRARLPLVDKDGVAVVHSAPPAGDRRTPVAVCQGAFRWWENLTRFAAPEEIEPNARKFFLNCADWLLAHGVTRGAALVWEYDFDAKNVKAPWISSMAQGHAMQVLVRAWLVTRDRKYLDAAERALEAFFTDIPDGGVRLAHPQNPGAWWYCEYPAPQNQLRVLNGMIFSLFGPHELWGATGNARAREAFDRGVAAIREHLHEYDAGNWSYYDARGQFATVRYHQIHINLLWRLCELTGEAKFREFAERWERYKPSLRTVNVLVWFRVAGSLLGAVWRFIKSFRERRAGTRCRR